MSILESLRVVEIGASPAVRFCGWLFAMNGAQVEYRRAEEGSGDRWSDAFLDTAKTRGTTSAWSPEDAAGTDVLLADPHIDWSAVDPQQVVSATVDEFGEDGPYRDWRGGELVLTALGGAAGYTRTVDGTPVYGYGDRYQYLTGMYLFQSVCACLLGGTVGAQAPLVRVSVYESIVSLLPYLTTQFEYNGSESTAEQSGPRFVSACKDGFVVIYAGFAWEPIARLIEREDLLEDPRFVRPGERFAHLPALDEIFAAWAAGLTVDEASRRGEEHDIAVTRVRSPQEVLADDSFAARDGWYDTGEGRVPTLPYTVDGLRTVRGPVAAGSVR